MKTEYQFRLNDLINLIEMLCPLYFSIQFIIIPFFLQRDSYNSAFSRQLNKTVNHCTLILENSILN